MNNETTASQPNSIGDDAQFSAGWIAAVTFIESRANDYLNEYATTEFDTGALVFCSNDHRLYFNDLTELAEDLRAALIKEESSRAPAAQASATIQAAPTGATFNDQSTAPESEKVRRVLQSMADLSISHFHSDGFPRCAVIKQDAAACLKVWAALTAGPVAAATPEPVMVAEPGLRNSAGARKHAERIDNMHKGVVGVFAAIKAEHLAAPMVADPAGVALPINATIRAVISKIAGDSGEGWCAKDEEDYWAELCAAATVKAVPSEALDVPQCGGDYYPPSHPAKDAFDAMLHLINEISDGVAIHPSYVRSSCKQILNTYPMGELSNALTSEAVPSGALDDEQAYDQSAYRHFMTFEHFKAFRAECRAAPLAYKTGGGE